MRPSWPGRGHLRGVGPVKETVDRCVPGPIGRTFVERKAFVSQMTELSINASEIADVLRRNLEGYSPGVTGEEVGRIRDIGDGIAMSPACPTWP